MMFWSLSSSALLAAWILLRRLLRGKLSPGLRYAVWLLVLLRLLIPGTVFRSRASAENLVARAQVSQDLETLDGIDLVFYREENRTVEGWYAGQHSGDRAVVLAEDTTWEEYSRLDQTRRWREVLRGSWVLGMAVSGAVLLGCNLSFGRRLRRSRREIDIPSDGLPVYVCEGLRSPCLFGLFRPAVYITPEVEADETKLRHVLAHETTHFRHGDHLWSALRGVCLVLHWYDPLVWYGAALSRRDAELCCDAGSIRRLGEAERAEYGRTLIGLSVKKAGGFDLVCCATTMSGGKAALKERVSMIAQQPKTRRFAAVLVAAAAAVAAACLFTGARGESWREEVRGWEPDGADSGLPAPVDGGGRERPEDPALRLNADLDHDGRDDEAIAVVGEAGMFTVALCDEGDDGLKAVWSTEISTSHAGWAAVFLCEAEGEAYLLYYQPYMGTGIGEYRYTLLDSSLLRREDLVRFSVTPGSVDLPAQEMADFAEEVNALLEHSTLLISTLDGEVTIGPADASPYYERYGFMDEDLRLAGEIPLKEKIVRYAAYLEEQWGDALSGYVIYGSDLLGGEEESAPALPRPEG